MTATHDRPPALVADIGGTHSRFGRLVRRDLTSLSPLAPAGGAAGGSDPSELGPISHQRVLRNDDHPGLVAAVRSYLVAALADSPAGHAPREAALAVACPVSGDDVQLTNRNWAFSIAAAQRELGLDRLLVLNDFAALALALPHLEAGGRELWHPGTALPGAPLGVLGPGTGLGVGGLVPVIGAPSAPATGSSASLTARPGVDAATRWIPLASEGGHRDLAATTNREWQILGALADRFGHVSAERVLSGPGLAALYHALATVDGDSAPDEPTPADIAPRAAAGDPIARETLELFATWLGAVAGDLALTLGARGGMYLAGGIVPKLGAQFRRDLFLGRYFAKGRFRSYLEAIPLYLVTHPTAALIGAAAALADG